MYWATCIFWANLTPCSLQCFVNQSTFNFPGISQHGYKKSGLGTEGGMEGLLEYMEIKSIAKNKGADSHGW